MTKAKVYFSDMRTRYGGLSLPQKLGKLIEAAGIGDIDFQNKFAAIKIHFGEPGNLSFLRPNYAKVVVDTVAAQGGRPFLTDCNTLYVGRRKHALEHITAAYEGKTGKPRSCSLVKILLKKSLTSPQSPLSCKKAKAFQPPRLLS